MSQEHLKGKDVLLNAVVPLACFAFLVLILGRESARLERINSPKPMGPDDRSTLSAPLPDETATTVVTNPWDACIELNNPMTGYPGKFNPDAPIYETPEEVIAELGADPNEVYVRVKGKSNPYDKETFYSNDACFYPETTE